MTNPRSIVLASSGMRFPALELGPADGPVVLCLHGFPDTHHGWFEGGDASFAARVAAAGFRVVAPAMRGTTPETLSAEHDYAPFTLGGDVLDHAAQLGPPVSMVASDWGAFAAYIAAARAPERLRRLVTLGIPHPLALKLTPAMLWRARHFVTFQLQARAARWLRKDDFAALDVLYRRWSPTWSYPPAALADVKRAYAEPGVVEAALAPYKAIAKHRKAFEGLFKATKIAVPTLALGGGGDPSVPESSYERARRGFSGDYQWGIVPEVGHFVHREDPATTAERVVAFLKA